MRDRVPEDLTGDAEGEVERQQDVLTKRAPTPTNSQASAAFALSSVTRDASTTAHAHAARVRRHGTNEAPIRLARTERLAGAS